MPVRTVDVADAPSWERMRQALWPASAGEHARDIAAFFAGDHTEPAEVVLALGEDGRPVGFAELSIRPFADGCSSRPVAYLEGWYVDPAARGRGVGAALVRAAEAWGRSRGCTELASDTEIDNADSAAAHRSLGFTETGRIICFRKAL